MSPQKRASGRQRSRGQALVEFSLVIPVFLMIFFGILDFGYGLYTRITLTNATREGAHAAVTQVDNAPGIPVMVEAAVRASGDTLILADLGVTTTCIAGPTHGSCNFSGVAGTLVPGDSIRVVTTYTYHSFFLRFINTTVPFSTTVTMVVE